MQCRLNESLVHRVYIERMHENCCCRLLMQTFQFGKLSVIEWFEFTESKYERQENAMEWNGMKESADCKQLT